LSAPHKHRREIATGIPKDMPSTDSFSSSFPVVVLKIVPSGATSTDRLVE
jgi:hypothetical protein